MKFEILGEISGVETIAVGRSIRERDRLQKTYGVGRWRKLKGFATIIFEDGATCRAELH